MSLYTVRFDREPASEPVTLDAIAEANVDFFAPEDVDALAALYVGGELLYGGGAGPLVTITRVE